MATEKKTEAAAEKLPDPYELEEIFIPRAGAKEDPNLFVSVNGKNFLIPKGKKSKVPRYIALVDTFEHIGMTGSSKVQKNKLREHAIRHWHIQNDTVAA